MMYAGRCRRFRARSADVTMMHVARTRVSTAESAAEVVQDTWLAVLTGIDRFEARSNVR